jgi:hypothetical protein
MGREIRRIPVGWEHPLDLHPNPARPPNEWDWTGQGRHFEPLLPREYMEDIDDEPSEYMPKWPEGTPLGYQLYETVTEGTPLSPSFATPEELADFLVGRLRMFSDRAAALRLVNAGWAPSFVSNSQGIQPGYEWVAEKDGTP